MSTATFQFQDVPPFFENPADSVTVCVTIAGVSGLTLAIDVVVSFDYVGASSNPGKPYNVLTRAWYLMHTHTQERLVGKSSSVTIV